MKDPNSIQTRYEETGVALCLVRRDIYALLSAVTAFPHRRYTEPLNDPSTRRILACAFEMLSEDDRFRPSSLGPGETNPADLKLTLPAELGDRIAADYESVFGYCASKECCPYETEYCVHKEINFRTQEMADIAGFYRAFGLNVSQEARERVDHVSLETEFMSIVISRELHALENDLGPDLVELCREVQRTFFNDHLGWWLPAFGVMLGRQPSGIYSMLGKLICGFAAAERAFLGIPAFGNLPAASISLADRQMTCEQASPHAGT